MTDTDRLNLIEREEISLYPITDDRGVCTGWIANDAAALVIAGGATPREAMDNLEQNSK